MDITVQELQDKIAQKKEDLYIIDVREPHEYEAYNIGVPLIPLGNIPSKLEDLSKYKDYEVVVLCRSGARSASAQAFLQQNGFSNVRNLIGGMMQWHSVYG